jgi:hypothetical protein
MALNGRLEDLSPSELFQLVALTRKSGQLRMTRGSQQGVVVFRNGRVVFAASDSLRTAFDSALSQGRVGADATFIRQVTPSRGGKVTDSGSFIIEVGQDSAEELEKVVREQIQDTVQELVDWHEGEFVFEPLDLPESHLVALETGWLEPGVDSNRLVLNALTKLDEGDRDEWELSLEAAATVQRQEVEELRCKSEISAAFEVLVDEVSGEITWAPAVGGEVTAPKPTRHLENLRKIMTEMVEMRGMSPSLTAEVTLLILRYAAQIVNRGVLFAVRGDAVHGIGQFGLHFADDSADRRISTMVIPLSASSVFLRVLEIGRTVRGRLPATEWNRYLVDRLGGGEPAEMAAVPLIIDGAVVAVFYGDNLPESSLVGTVDGLEILMHEIGLAVEKARLERRLKVLETGEP